VKACGVVAAIAIGLAVPVFGIVAGALTDSMAPLLWSMTFVVLVGLVAVGWSRFRYELTRRSGVVTSARIVDVSRIDLGPMDLHVTNFYEVEYTYLDQNGVEHNGKSEPVRSIPLTSDEHFVRFDPSNPTRSVWIS
jgi:uncharacterized protein DUF3592